MGADGAERCEVEVGWWVERHAVVLRLLLLGMESASWSGCCVVVLIDVNEHEMRRHEGPHRSTPLIT